MAGDKKKIQEVNAGSMADIAFLLLIFFLVATTMNTDSGINRTLPPWVNEPQKEDAPQIKERNLMEVKVNQYDQILAAGQQVHITQLKDKAKEFYLNRNNDENMPEKEIVHIDLIGDFPVTSGVISLQNDRGTSYEMYIMVQNELTRAINEIRDEISVSRFGRTYSELTEDQQKAVGKAQPTAISEAEPRNLGGN